MIFACVGLERANSMEPIQGCLRPRLRALMATIDDRDTRELLEDTTALIEMNRRRRLSSTRVCRQ